MPNLVINFFQLVKALLVFLIEESDTYIFKSPMY